MSVDLHRQVEELMAQADHAKSQHRPDEAMRICLNAAPLEEAAYRHIPEDRPRTRGIIAISAVALYRDGGAPGQAIRLAHEVLATSAPVPPDARDDLYELITEIRLQELEPSLDFLLGPHVFDVSFAGGLADSGYAPIEAVSLKLQQLRNFLLRVAEWQNHDAFRVKGSANKKVEQMCRPVMSQPSLGSFRFKLRFAAPRQPELPGMETVLPDKVAIHFLDIVDAVTVGAAERLENQVRDEQYRTTFVKMVRGLVPAGDEIENIQIDRVSGDGGTVQSATISQQTGNLIRRSFPMLAPKNDMDRVEEAGILRALNLDTRYLTIVRENEKVRFRFDQGVILDDVVGPFVNHRVRAIGYKKGSQNYVQDVLPDPDGGSSPS
jgi:hypothetical protein